MNRVYLRWAPTTIYLTVAVIVCAHHAENMQPVREKLATVEMMFNETRAGLERGEQLSPAAQAEMARVAAHHIHHAADFVGWTTRAFWWLTLPGVLVAVVQGWVCLRWPSHPPSSSSATSWPTASSSPS